jgi:hypothetical protein
LIPFGKYFGLNVLVSLSFGWLAPRNLVNVYVSNGLKFLSSIGFSSFTFELVCFLLMPDIMFGDSDVLFFAINDWEGANSEWWSILI